MFWDMVPGTLVGEPCALYMCLQEKKEGEKAKEQHLDLQPLKPRGNST